MGIWARLLSTDYGQMSLAGLAFIVLMAVWFAWYFNKKIKEDDKNRGK